MPPPLFDTHCHLDFEPFKNDLSGEIEKARTAGVEKIFIPSVGEWNWDEVARISEIYPGIYYGLGMHPYFFDRHTYEHVALLDSRLQQQCRHGVQSGCVAVGECGLDFALTEYDEAAQQALFEQHIGLAKKYSLPLVLHCRKAHQPMVKMLKKAQLSGGGVLHGFSGSYQQAKSFIDLGFYIGVGGTITYPRANKTRSTISALPLDSLVLETDAPDMPLYGYQGRPNHPMMLKMVLNELILLRKEEEQTIACQIWQNGCNLFGFS
ncbi:deoxyribonuclease [Vibrio albus]|uniref:Deoxyribonuclease n=1 Tax=Vibrio albus TaxID=2200953 RepID=A0A2U3BF33_9VIBR|nr:deoxyribonuclease [Vibrio albus]